jgi:hypothetical protein
VLLAEGGAFHIDQEMLFLASRIPHLTADHAWIAAGAKGRSIIIMRAINQVICEWSIQAREFSRELVALQTDNVVRVDGANSAYRATIDSVKHLPLGLLVIIEAADELSGERLIHQPITGDNWIAFVSAGKFLHWLQERINRWIKPATPALISGYLSDLTRNRTDLIVENALLRQQLIVLNRQVKRPRLTNPDRFCLVLLSHLTKFWEQSLHIVQPDTLLRWHRELFRLYWRRKSRGKPKISSETIGLIQKMAEENHLWGAERIRGELLKLGIEVSKRSIQKYIPKERKLRSSG